MKQQEPRWSVRDLAENKNVNPTTIQSRLASSENAPKVCEPVTSNSHRRPMMERSNHRKPVMYKRSELLAWFDAEDQRKQFKRKEQK